MSKRDWETQARLVAKYSRATVARDLMDMDKAAIIREYGPKKKGRKPRKETPLTDVDGFVRVHRERVLMRDEGTPDSIREATRRVQERAWREEGLKLSHTTLGHKYSRVRDALGLSDEIEGYRQHFYSSIKNPPEDSE